MSRLTQTQQQFARLYDEAMEKAEQAGDYAAAGDYFRAAITQIESDEQLLQAHRIRQRRLAQIH